jgi:hypothetical protein
MKKYILFIAIILCSTISYGQYYAAKEFSKETASFYAKSFLFNEVFDSTDAINDIIVFDVLPLAAANSGELTTVFYKTKKGNKEGLLLCFWGDKWNKYGVVYKGYSFKNLNKEIALDLMSFITSTVEGYKYDLGNDETNLHFKKEGINFLISKSNNGYDIRLFWENFDATWEKTAFERSVKRFIKNAK